MHISVCIVNVEWNKFDLRNCGDPPVLEAALNTQLCHLGSEWRQSLREALQCGVVCDPVEYCREQTWMAAQCKSGLFPQGILKSPDITRYIHLTHHFHKKKALNVIFKCRNG